MALGKCSDRDSAILRPFRETASRDELDDDDSCSSLTKWNCLMLLLLRLRFFSYSFKFRQMNTFFRKSVIVTSLINYPQDPGMHIPSVSIKVRIFFFFFTRGQKLRKSFNILPVHACGPSRPAQRRPPPTALPRLLRLALPALTFVYFLLPVGYVSLKFHLGVCIVC